MFAMRDDATGYTVAVLMKDRNNLGAALEAALRDAQHEVGGTFHVMPVYRSCASHSATALQNCVGATVAS